MTRRSVGLLLLLAGLAGGGCSEDLLEPDIALAPEFVMEWGKKINVPGRLLQPTGISVGPDGRIYVGDTGHDLIQIYTPDGVWLDSLSVEMNWLRYLHVAGDTTIHLNDFRGGYRKLDREGAPVDPHPYSGILSITESPGGTVYLWGTWTDPYGNRSGGLIWRVEDPVPVRLAHITPGLLAVGRNEVLTVETEYAGDVGSYALVEQYDRDGVFLGKHALANSSIQVEYFRVDGAGNLLVINKRGRALEKYSPGGRFLVRWNVADDIHEPLHWPSGLALDADDNIYVTDWSLNRVVKFKNR